MLPDFHTQPTLPDALLSGLNPEQLAAVTLQNQHALVLAGAGSGKTRVLTTRMAWLMQTGQVSPHGLLAVTFTNKAAKEMLLRLQTMLPINVRSMWVGTFHGLCHRLLRLHAKAALLPATFQILDTQDQLSAIKRLCKQFAIDTERFEPKQLMWFIANCKEEGLRPANVPVSDEDSRKKVEIYQLYEDQCHREGVVDFAELMLRSFELLRDHPDLCQHYQQRFRFVLVDEFQDTNRLQYAWLKQLVGDGTSVMAVGDDDQSIYAFRGARVGNMTDFVREFAIDQPIKLEQNYRSQSHILDSANHLISHNNNRLGKNLRTDQGAGELVRVFESTSDFAEAQWVVDEIRHLAQSGGSPKREIAILYRSNAQSRILETTLFNAGLPYKVYGGLRFFERAEIKHALAYLRLLENPRDDTSFMRVVNFPPRGIGARTLEQLQDVAKDQGCALHDAIYALKGRPGAILTAFVNQMNALRERIQGQNLSQIVQLMLEQSNLLAHYRADKEGQDRVDNLEELVNAAQSFVTQEGFGRDAPATQTTTARLLSQSPASQGISAALPWDEVIDEPAPELGDNDFESGETLSPLQAFLSHAALEAGDNQAEVGADAVQLMSVHAAKGLEFDAVFITGLEESLFPHDRSLSDTQGLEEERRLMYVAITRARKRLYISHSQTRMLNGQTRYNVRSRFLDELPAHAIRQITPSFKPTPSGFRPGAYGGSGSAATYQPQRWGGQTNTAAPWAEPTDATTRATAATAKKLEAQLDRSTHIATGNKVFHNKFGEGKVLTLEGVGADARAQIAFSRHGTKWLALSVAKLTLVDG